MMAAEYSVSAIALRYPDEAYFSVGVPEEGAPEREVPGVRGVVAARTCSGCYGSNKCAGERRGRATLPTVLFPRPS
jgi:hypothetical protein